MIKLLSCWICCVALTQFNCKVNIFMWSTLFNLWRLFTDNPGTLTILVIICCLWSYYRCFDVSVGFQRFALSDKDPHVVGGGRGGGVGGGAGVVLEQSLSWQTSVVSGESEILTVWLPKMQEHPPTDTHKLTLLNLLPVGTHTLPCVSTSSLSSLLLPCSCLTCLTASFVISNHLLSERLWQTRVLAASVWWWELGFPAE